MTTQAEITAYLESMIPAGLWAKYSHLSFEEMADRPELEEWADDLRQAEIDWYEADDA